LPAPDVAAPPDGAACRGRAALLLVGFGALLAWSWRQSRRSEADDLAAEAARAMPQARLPKGQAWRRVGLALLASVTSLPELASTLNQLRTSSDSTNTKVLVTIYANELALYERVIDVLDALTRAKISNVTFQAGAPE
jgi:HAMP domain-containing protein